MEPYKVYIMADGAGRVTAINSSAFMSSLEGWTEIDSGYGDRCHHAQGNYLPGPLMDERGICRYKLAGGEVVERSQDEMDGDWVEPEPVLTAEEMLAALMGGIADATK